MIGSPLGHYEILESLGSGGMGEVYRARDAHLKREVAVKVLPDDLADDPDRLARLEREAHLLAALNHSNIATIHSLEEAEGRRFLVMELVPGQSLEAMLVAGPIPVDEALDICRQIAEALEAAHEQGIIHRDLKPANVLVTPEGKAKVLDFGLAKTVERAGYDTDMSHSPTITIAGTQAGVIMGTAPYMSPEQVRGKRLDKRTDIWAFGCVLFEALTGHKAFDRETVADTLAAIIEVEPPWDVLPAATPIPVRSLLHRCLRKDRKRRLHDVADARIEIEEALGLPGSAPVPIASDVAPPPTWWRAVPWSIAVVSLVMVGTIALWFGLRGTATPAWPAPPTHFSLRLPGDLMLGSGDAQRVAISPDGTKIAYRATGAASDTSPGLYLHDLDQLEPVFFRDLPRSFFSHDGQWLAFFQGGKLKKVSLSGGTPEDVCDMPASAEASESGAWAEDTIVFAAYPGGLWRVADGGGDPDLILAPDPARGETSFWNLRLIPGRNAVVFGILMADGLYTDDAEIAVLDLDTLEVTRGIAKGNVPTVLPTGHLVYANADRLYAQAFDLDTYRVYGPSAEVMAGVDVGAFGNATYAVAENGTLVYVPGELSRDELVWIDEHNVVTPALDRELIYTLDNRLVLYKFGLSHDRQLMAAEVGIRNRDIETYDLSSGRRLRPLVRDRLQEIPALIPDGSGYYFHEHAADGYPIYRHDLLGSGEPELVDLDLGDYDHPMPMSVSPDGKWLTVMAESPATDYDVLLVSLEGEPSARPWLATEARESMPLFSPDGRWIAYLSDRTGQQEVYLREVFAPETQAIQVTFANPPSYAWGPDGRAVYYFRTSVAEPYRFWKVSIEPDGEPSAAEVAWDFDGDGFAYYYLNGMWGIGADGRLLAIRGTVRPSTQMNVYTNWFEKVKAAVPTHR